jgi:hypothetical protein
MPRKPLSWEEWSEGCMRLSGEVEIVQTKEEKREEERRKRDEERLKRDADHALWKKQREEREEKENRESQEKLKMEARLEVAGFSHSYPPSMIFYSHLSPLPPLLLTSLFLIYSKTTPHTLRIR